MTVTEEPKASSVAFGRCRGPRANRAIAQAADSTAPFLVAFEHNDLAADAGLATRYWLGASRKRPSSSGPRFVPKEALDRAKRSSRSYQREEAAAAPGSC